MLLLFIWQQILTVVLLVNSFFTLQVHCYFCVSVLLVLLHRVDSCSTVVFKHNLSIKEKSVYAWQPCNTWNTTAAACLISIWTLELRPKMYFVSSKWHLTNTFKISLSVSSAGGLCQIWSHFLKVFQTYHVYGMDGITLKQLLRLLLVHIYNKWKSTLLHTVT